MSERNPDSRTRGDVSLGGREYGMTYWMRLLTQYYAKQLCSGRGLVEYYVLEGAQPWYRTQRHWQGDAISTDLARARG